MNKRKYKERISSFLIRDEIQHNCYLVLEALKGWQIYLLVLELKILENWALVGLFIQPLDRNQSPGFNPKLSAPKWPMNEYLSIEETDKSILTELLDCSIVMASLDKEEDLQKSTYKSKVGRQWHMKKKDKTVMTFYRK